MLLFGIAFVLTIAFVSGRAYDLLHKETDG